MNACYWLAVWSLILLAAFLVSRPMSAEVRKARSLIREVRRR